MQVVVIGMHRSGTSAVTRLINMMGAYFGPESLSKGFRKVNYKGFWERKDVLRLNRDILASAGARWNRIAAFETAVLDEKRFDEFRSRARRIILEMDAHRPWVVKEPCLCLTFPVWREALEVPVCVHVNRSPIQVARSLQVRDAIPLDVGIALWEKYLRTAIAVTRGVPHVFIRYEQLMSDPLGESRLLLDGLRQHGVRGLSMPGENEIGSFIDPDLHRNRGGDELLERYASKDPLALNRRAFAGSLFETPIGETLSGRAEQALRTYEAELIDQGALPATEPLRSSTIQEERRERAAGKDERKRLEAELKSQRRETRRLCTDLARARDVEAKRRVRYAENLRAKSKKSDADLKNLTAKLKTRDADVRNLSATLRTQARDIRALKQSISWRITRPMRTVSRSLRWLVRNMHLPEA